MKAITPDMTDEELDAWTAEFVASVEDGSLRAETEIGLDPEWLAKYGDASWAAALAVVGYGPPTLATDAEG